MHTHAKWVLVVVWAASLAAFPQTGTRVTLNVVAFDSHDQTVGDLTSLDFQVSDQSKPQHIVSFHRNGEPQGTLNTLPHAPQVGPPVVILFDLLNDNLSKRGFGTEEIIQALEHLESSDSLYLYLLSSQGDLQPVRGLPAPQEHNPPQTKPWTEHIKPLLTAAIDHAYGVKLGNAGTFPAIEAIGAALQPFPGRKNLIWITNGVPLSSRERGASIDNSSLVNGMATTLDRNGVTLSSVYLGSNVGNGDIDTLEQFADLTGGKVYANDIEKAVKQGMAASGSGYVIQYDGPRLDGKYHKIRVTCSRKGVHLQVKQGYYAN